MLEDNNVIMVSVHLGWGIWFNEETLPPTSTWSPVSASSSSKTWALSTGYHGQHNDLGWIVLVNISRRCHRDELWSPWIYWAMKQLCWLGPTCRSSKGAETQHDPQYRCKIANFLVCEVHRMIAARWRRVVFASSVWKKEPIGQANRLFSTTLTSSASDF